MKQFRMILAALAVGVATAAQAQLYTGLSGLIHTPSADMNETGDVRIGGYFLNSHFTPDGGFTYDGEKYGTADFYASVTPFSWIEIAYTFTLFKTKIDGYDGPSYNQKDRYFSVKIRPLKEGRYWPSIALGTNDPFNSRGTSDGGYFANYYLAATKHFGLARQTFGIHAAYRYYRREYNKKWQGVVGGVTWNPSFAPNLRAIVEYTGDGVNVGADCLLWRHLFLQATLQDGRYFSGGACYQVNLF